MLPAEISVLVVDDSAVVRRLITTALTGTRGIRVVGIAQNGQIAQTKIAELRPDVVTMDIEMPVMDGITAVRELRRRHPRLPVIMFSTLSSSGAAATLDALAAGATDYVTKPSNVANFGASMTAVREQLVPKIEALSGKRAPAPTTPPRTAPSPSPSPSPKLTPSPAAQRGVEVVAIGSSTGGPDALAKVLLGLPPDLPVPVVVTQHMPPVFTKMFAERLDRNTPLRVVEAAGGMTVTPGTVYIAPGDFHLVFEKKATGVVTRLSTAPPENSCRPAVDVMFRSVGATWGGGALAVVLTGMGHDGRNGARELRTAGARVIAQDEATSVVWGMPGAVVGAGLADMVLPIAQIAPAVLTRLNRAARAGVR